MLSFTLSGKHIQGRPITLIVASLIVYLIYFIYYLLYHILCNFPILSCSFPFMFVYFAYIIYFHISYTFISPILYYPVLLSTFLYFSYTVLLLLSPVSSLFHLSVLCLIAFHVLLLISFLRLCIYIMYYFI